MWIEQVTGAPINRAIAEELSSIARQQVIDAAGPVWRTEPLRDDPLAAERVGVLEDDRPVGLEMLIERDPVASVSEQIREHGLAALDRLPPKVLAVEFDQIAMTAPCFPPPSVPKDHTPRHGLRGPELPASGTTPRPREKEIAVVRGHDRFVNSAAFSPDGSRIVTASNDGTARIWNAATQREIAVMRGTTSDISEFCAHPSTPTGRASLRRQRTRPFRVSRTLRVDRPSRLCAAMAIGSLPPSSAPDGSRIVTASYDDTAHIWDAATGKVIAVLPGSAVSAAFSPDGSRIVTGEPTEGAVHIWAVATGKGIAVMRGHVVLSAAFSPDGSRIVTASEDQTCPHLGRRDWKEPNRVVIAEDTRKLLGNLFELEDLGAKDLKGIAGRVRAFAALRASSAEGRFEAMHTTGLTDLVGREEELELLLRRWSKAKTGEGQVVLLSGEPGIGKSRLTAALLERVASEPHTRLRYFCSPQHTDSERCTRSSVRWNVPLPLHTTTTGKRSWTSLMLCWRRALRHFRTPRCWPKCCRLQTMVVIRRSN